jgi:hypothetical protein
MQLQVQTGFRKSMGILGASKHYAIFTPSMSKGTHTHTHVHICTYSYVHMYTCTHVHIWHTGCFEALCHLHTLYVQRYTHKHKYTYTHIHIYTYTHIHIYTCTHVHMYTYGILGASKHYAIFTPSLCVCVCVCVCSMS